MPKNTSIDYNLLESLAEEFAARHRRGENPTLEEYCLRHPKLANDIREILPTMMQLEQAQKQISEEIKAGKPIAGREGTDAERSSCVDESDKARKEPVQPVLTDIGDFHIIREVGRGGMGIVYEAEQLSLHRRVALKVLTTRLLTNELQKRRFEREAQAAARLHHTNIVPVFGFGDSEGMPYYVMQFIQGQGLDAVIEEVGRLERRKTGPQTVVQSQKSTAGDLAHSLIWGKFRRDHESEDKEKSATDKHRANTPSHPSKDQNKQLTGSAESRSLDRVTSLSMPSFSGTTSSLKPKRLTYWQSVARIGIQVAQGLGHVHQLGIVHRDIKPSNLMLDLQGTVWITDFGLAKVDDQENLTGTGDILGTLRYIPPEAFTSKTDEQGDIYSLGLTLYEMLALRPAFGERNKNQIISQVTEGRIDHLGKVRPDIPHDLQMIVHKAIEYDKTRRYASAHDLELDLQRFLADEPIAARPPTIWEQARRLYRRRPALVTGILTTALTAIVLTISLIGWSAYQRHQRLNTILEEGTSYLDLAKVETSAQKKDQLYDTALQRFAAARILDDSSREAKQGLYNVYESLIHGRLSQGQHEAAQALMIPLREASRDLGNPTEHLRELERAVQGIARLTVNANVPGAIVTLAPIVNNVSTMPTKLGTTPSVQHDLQPGYYQVTVQATGYQEFRQPLLVGRSEPINLDVRLLKPEEVPIGMVYVPAGTFLAGDPQEAPLRSVNLPGFLIDEAEVIGEAYEEFVSATNWPPPDSWSGSRCPRHLRALPVHNVSWFDAAEYARWSGKRLPTEWEWEKAARGVDGRNYPWGQRFMSEWCVSKGKKITSPRDLLEGRSPYGCIGMAGNVWEWTSSRDYIGYSLRVFRGGSVASEPDELLVYRRKSGNPKGSSDGALNHLGFRCAKSLPGSPALTDVIGREDLKEAGEFFLARGRVDIAQQYPAQLLQLNPRSVIGNLWMARCLAEKRNWPAVLEHYLTAYTQLDLGDELQKETAREIDIVVEQLQKTNEKIPNMDRLQVPVLKQLTRDLLDKKKYKEAEEPVRKALQLDPANGDCVEWLEQVLRYTKRSEEAKEARTKRIEAYRLLLKEDPDLPALLLQVADYFAEDKAMMDEAISLAKRAAKLEYKNPKCHFELAKLLEWAGSRTEAYESIQAALQLDPNNQDYLRLRERCEQSKK